MTLTIETSSLTSDRRIKFIEALEPMFTLSEMADEAEATILSLARRDGEEMTMKDRRSATLAAFGAGLTVLRTG
jgi:hypothetical protein